MDPKALGAFRWPVPSTIPTQRARQGLGAWRLHSLLSFSRAQESPQGGFPARVCSFPESEKARKDQSKTLEGALSGCTCSAKGYTAPTGCRFCTQWGDTARSQRKVQVSGRLYPDPRQVSGRLHPDPHLLPSVSPVCWQLFPTTLPPEICSLLFPDFLQISTPSSPFCNAFSNRPSQTTS